MFNESSHPKTHSRLEKTIEKREHFSKLAFPKRDNNFTQIFVHLGSSNFRTPNHQNISRIPKSESLLR